MELVRWDFLTPNPNFSGYAAHIWTVHLGVKLHVLVPKTACEVFSLISCHVSCVIYYEGVLLHYLNSTMRTKTLCQIFGASPSVISRVINKAMAELLSALRVLPCGAISWPTPDKMDTFARMISAREPRLEHVFGFLDGVWFPIFNHPNPIIQNAYFNGWKQCTNVSNIVSTMMSCVTYTCRTCNVIMQDMSRVCHLHVHVRCALALMVAFSGCP